MRCSHRLVTTGAACGLSGLGRANGLSEGRMPISQVNSREKQGLEIVRLFYAG
jgi:hypothetical protein